MRRTIVQFDEATYGRLRREAFKQERSVASLVRELVARGLDRPQPRKQSKHQRLFSWVGIGRSKQGRLSPVSERHDEALAEIYGK